MDCCENTNQKKKENQGQSMKGGKNIMELRKNTMMWAIIGVLFLAVLFLTFKASSLTGKAAIDSSGKLDTSGWSENEKMNYDMHETVPARLQGRIAASTTSGGTGMVGGC